MTLHGHITSGQVVFDHPVSLPEGAAVQVEIVMPALPEQNAENGAASGQSLTERLQKFVGKFDGSPPDASVNLDHYLYGTPKRP
jgi:hypothetical protein